MKNNLFRILPLFFLLSSSLAIAQQTWSLYPGKIPNSLNCPDKEVTQVTKLTGRKIIEKITVPTLTVFIPKTQNSAKPAIIICPGGGYVNLSIFDGGYDIAKELASNGIVAFVLKYRTSDSTCNTNNSLVPLQDLQQAIYTVKSMAQKWNIDIEKVGLLGLSAGGHLSALEATQYRKQLIDSKGVSLKPAFTILAYPVISFTDELTSKIARTRRVLLGNKPSASQINWFSPEKNVDKDTPPAFLLQASDDSTSLVENSIVYYQALHHSKVSAEMIIYQKGGHGFAGYNKAEDDDWILSAIKWMKLNKFFTN